MMRSIKIYQTGLVKAVSNIAPFDWVKNRLEKLYAKKLSELKGVPLKISQILSMSNDSSKSELFINSQSQLQPFDVSIMLDHLKVINHPLYEKIEEISEKCYPASMGQVHCVKLEDGKEFAVKILYPHIEECLKIDEKFVSLVFSAFSQFKEGFSLESYKKIIAEDIKNELDLNREIYYQAKIYDHFLSHKNIIVPCPFPALSNKHCLLMSFEKSEPFQGRLETISLDHKYSLANTWVDYFFEMLFELNLVHADPNPGNYGIRIKNECVQLVVYDYGSVFEIKKEQTIILLKIFNDVLEGKSDLLPLLVGLGFNAELLLPIQDKLLAFFDLLAEPFISDGRYDLKTWNRKERAKNILGDDRWNFMIAAPASLMPLMRMIHGFFYYINLLEVGVYAKCHVQKYINKNLHEFSLLKLEKVLDSPLTISRYLVISVIEKQVQKVKVKLPRKAIEQLDDFMDDEIKMKLESQSINVEMIVNRARSSGYKVQNLFDLVVGEKKIKINLE